MSEVIVRLFVESDAIEASEVAERVRYRLEAVAACAQVRIVRPYWKIDGYQEVCLDLRLSEDASSGVSAATSALGSGWKVLSGGDAVWNDGDGAAFVEPLVRWAHVEPTELTS